MISLPILRRSSSLATIAFALAWTSSPASSVPPEQLWKPPAEDWPTYHGDSSGRHYSPLAQVNRSTLSRLGLAWTAHLNTARPSAPASDDQPKPAARAFPIQLKAIPLVHDGIIYMVAGAQIQALDARDGRLIWRYQWDSAIGAQLGRGVALYQDSVIAQTGLDNHVVSVDARTGHERWRVQVTDSPLGYGGTTAPIVAGKHLILGMGGDGNNLRAWLESRDPDTGELQWKWYVTPSEGEPGIETWPDVQSAARGGGMPWQQVTYDPALDLIFVPTANPVPTFSAQVRAGDNLYTNSIVALHAATGKMAWYFQTTPNDSHDFDATQVPILIDAPIHGVPRQLLAQVNRNGYFYVLDRTSGKSVLTAPYLSSANWAKGVNPNGQPITNPLKSPQPGGTLVSPMSDGAANYPPPSYSPRTRLLYAQTNRSYSIYYLNPEEDKPIGWGGGSEYHLGYVASSLVGIDYSSGRIAWRHEYPGLGFVNSAYPGVLSTGGGLIFTGDPSGNFVSFDAKSGVPLWHSTIGSVRNTPITYAIDGRQYILVATDENLYAFALNDAN
jgi:acido-empty-quinoprotein group A